MLQDMSDAEDGLLQLRRFVFTNCRDDLGLTGSLPGKMLKGKIEGESADIHWQLEHFVSS